ncbi:MAG TPA: phosphatase PAP2 family protein [Gammaproteobacteria bacterium]|nr:phosphatase PAP2 family protein [Gammaproteobacteria bacterium]
MPKLPRRSGPRPARGSLALLLLPAGLTLLALLPFAPLGPFDARTGQAIAGTELTMSWAGALIEPLAAVGRMLAGAPDPKLAAIATLAWVAMAGLLLGAVRGRGWRRLAIAPAAALAAAVIFLTYVAFYMVVPLPGWSLSTPGRQAVIADLQSHTRLSHDGVVTAATNLRIHRARGVDVVAVTEHQDPRGSFHARRVAAGSDGAPAVIPGIELRGKSGYLLGLGLKEGIPLPDELDSRAAEAAFIRHVHRDHHGAVVALSWRLDADDVRFLAASGIDGFEIANAGHPDIPAATRRAVLAEARERGLALLADSDWHGWTGYWRTWTQFPTAALDATGPGSRAQQVVRLLRERGGERMTPVTAGHLGPPSTLRVAFAPWVETVRYGLGLSPRRLLGWWLWAGLLLGAAAGCRRRRWSPLKVVGGAGLGLLGAALLVRGGGMRLAAAGAADVANPPFLGNIGGWGLGVGGAALAAGLLTVAAGAGRLAAPALPRPRRLLRGLRRRLPRIPARWWRLVSDGTRLKAAWPGRIPPRQALHPGWAAAVVVMAALSYAFLDRTVAAWADARFHGSEPLKALSELGRAHWYLLAALAVYLIWSGRLGRARATLLFWSVAVSGLIADGIKVLLGRPRPDLFLEQGLYGFDFLRLDAHYLSLPSGHAATAFSVAACLALFWPGGRWLWLALAAAVAASRVLLAHHYVSDVLVGAWIGVMTVIWLHHNQRRPIRR